MFEFISAYLTELNSIGLFFVSCGLLAVAYNQYSLTKVVSSTTDVALDTYKGHHEHILLANRDKNCCEEVSSKTDPEFIRETSEYKDCGAFTTKERKNSGCVTRTEAAKG